jgi:hypothetical protein
MIFFVHHLTGSGLCRKTVHKSKTAQQEDKLNH